MIRRVVLCLALPTLAAACRTADQRPAAGPDSARAVAVDPGTPAGQIALELWQMRAGLTLGDWKNAHPDEPILGSDTSGLVNESFGEWCAFAAHRAPIGHDTLLRAAYFYTPAPPPGLAVPDSGAADLVRQCVLGLVWVNVEVSDSVAAVAASDTVRKRLVALYGAALPGSVRFPAAASWIRTARFHQSDLQIVAAMRGWGYLGRQEVRRPSVTAFAFRPNSGISVDSSNSVIGVWSPIDTVPLDSAALLSTLERSLYTPLLALMNPASTRGGTPPYGQAPDSLIRPLSRWIAASAALPPPRRSAALYVADRVLEHGMCSHFLYCDDLKAPALQRLRVLGARFSWSKVGDAVLYEHTWLTQARNLDRDSPLGQRILLAQLSAGFDLSGTCAGGSEGFRTVIENGERYLERVPDSPIGADVHFLIAEAYRDIVALARGAGGEWADSTKYQGEAAEAARRAIVHYVAAIAAGNGGPVAHRAWTQAWRLRAGLIPKHPRFFCVDD